MSVVQASQVGLVWRLARRILHIQGGGQYEEWEDPSPWEQRSSQGQEGELPRAGHPRTEGIGKVTGERKVKMANVLDQGDDTEFTAGDPSKMGVWVQREEPTHEQVTALERRAFVT